MPAATPNDDMDSFAGRVGYHVRRLRDKHGLDLEECAAFLGVAIATWYRLESGWHDGMAGKHLAELSRLFGVDMLELVRKPRS